MGKKVEKLEKIFDKFGFKVGPARDIICTVKRVQPRGPAARARVGIITNAVLSRLFVF